ncbi:uncharacterized protein LOC123504825 isoform X3 [Portunus trituberculatus]|uniref:uncharacterized protein LOC123504825 isoform X3 n=1 Tax=Portunus trituberculatus TaxID=210409 RepID=UPI001E1D204E|nr:uncharacterized protein LOC123504825 isoform X3 [Portunus trituberculatus]
MFWGREHGGRGPGGRTAGAGRAREVSGGGGGGSGSLGPRLAGDERATPACRHDTTTTTTTTQQGAAPPQRVTVTSFTRPKLTPQLPSPSLHHHPSAPQRDLLYQDCPPTHHHPPHTPRPPPGGVQVLPPGPPPYSPRRAPRSNTHADPRPDPGRPPPDPGKDPGGPAPHVAPGDTREQQQQQQRRQGVGERREGEAGRAPSQQGHQESYQPYHQAAARPGHATTRQAHHATPQHPRLTNLTHPHPRQATLTNRQQQQQEQQGVDAGCGRGSERDSCGSSSSSVVKRAPCSGQGPAGGVCAAAQSQPGAGPGGSGREGRGAGRGSRGSGCLVWVSLPGGGARLEYMPVPALATIKATPALPATHAVTRPRGGGGGGGGKGEGAASGESAAKNLVSSAPGGGGGRVAQSGHPPQQGAVEQEGAVLTVAGRGAGQVVRIRVRPEVHAYLTSLPAAHAHTGPLTPLARRGSRQDSQSSGGSALTGGSEGGEGSAGYHDHDYQEAVGEYTLLRRALDDHDPHALSLLAATLGPEGSGTEYPYLREMKERLLLSRDPPLASMDDASPHDPADAQMLEVHQTPVGTVVKLNADGYGSHTSPTHRVESLYTATLESRRGVLEYYPKNAKTSTFITLSLLYATLLVVVCLGFVLSEVLTHNVPLYYYEAFFTYLYGVSILFLLYVLCYLLSDSARDRKPKQSQVNAGHRSGQYNVSDYEYYACSEKVRQSEGLADGSPTQEKLTSTTSSSKPKKHKTSDNDHSHGSFFLRIGAIAFGLGTMIYNGLEFGVFFEIPLSSPCYQILRGVNPLLQLVFTFMQMYFIFMNARLNIHKFKFLARFGLMHIVATNLCVWVRTLVRESLKEINEFRVSEGHRGEDYMILEGIRRALENRGLMAPNKYLYNLDDFVEMQEINETMQEANTMVNEEDLVNRTCQRVEIMGSIVSDSAPYLYPFIVEYSLIAAAVLYIMWKHIGRNPRFVYDAESAGDGMSVVSRRCHSRVDCVGASKGLFCGLLVLVASLICLILFFVLVNQKELKMLAIYLADCSHCGIMFFSIIAIFIGFVRVRQLKFHGEREEELDDILLMVSAFGLFAYAVFSTVAGSLSAYTREPNLLVMVTGIMSVLQVIIQMVFIKDTQRRQVSLPEHERTKPGRQVVTFLLICNLTMWVIYTFETQKVEANPVQLEFFGDLPWTILLRCTLPLAIFHRFHSTVVLAAIWKNSYKTRIE